MTTESEVSARSSASAALELFPYQRSSVDWLKPKRAALLANDMGLGKSAIAITAAREAALKNILIICPAIAIENWRREFDKWWPDKLAGNTPPTIVSYNKIQTASEVKSASSSTTIKRKKWDCVIVDECHYLKNHSAKRTQQVFSAPNGVAHHTSHFWALSGTPAPNNASELWVLLRTFGRTTLSFAEFTKLFCNGYYFDHHFKPTGTKAEMIPQLKTLLSPIMLRYTAKDVPNDLPPLVHTPLFVEAHPLPPDVLPPGLLGELEAVLDGDRQLLARIIEQAGDDNTKLLELLKNNAQSLSTIRRYVGLQKAAAVAALIDQEIRDGAYSKIVIFAHHKSTIGTLATLLKAHSPAVITGEVGEKERWRGIDAFQATTEAKTVCRVLIAQIQAAGTAINLTAASQVLFIEQSWVPGDNAQAVKRCHRYGQKSSTVFSRTAVLEGDALDSKIAKALDAKSHELFLLLDNG